MTFFKNKKNKFFFVKKLFFKFKGSTFAPQNRKGRTRGVAQLVAYNVRDVGVASSSLATPTEFQDKPLNLSGFFIFP